MQIWDWKYSKNPHGSPIIWVAEDKDRIVGCYLLNPVKLRVGSTLVIGAQPVDAAVDNSYRGGGIFKKLAVAAISEAARNGVSLIYAFPTEISFKGQVRIGYHPVFIIPKMFRVFRISSLLEERIHIDNNFVQRELGKIDNFQKARKQKLYLKSNQGLKVRVINNFNSKFEDFWKKICKENNDVLVERDLEYLNWRYMKHPEKHYVSYVCEINDEIVGYAVVNVEKNVSMEREGTGKLSVGNIIDLLTLPSMTEAAYPLIASSCSHFENERVDIAGCWMFKWHPLYPILRKFGFSDFYEVLRRSASRSKDDSHIICYMNSKAAIQEAMRSFRISSDCHWWFMTQGDADYT